MVEIKKVKTGEFDVIVNGARVAQIMNQDPKHLGIYADPKRNSYMLHVIKTAKVIRCGTLASAKSWAKNLDKPN